MHEKFAERAKAEAERRQRERAMILDIVGRRRNANEVSPLSLVRVRRHVRTNKKKKPFFYVLTPASDTDTMRRH